MNDTLIKSEIKDAAAKFLTLAEKPSIAAQALSEICAELAPKVKRLPGAETFWNQIAKAFGCAQLHAFIAEKEFNKTKK